MPKYEQSALSKFKSIVNMSDKKFLDKTLLEKAKERSVFPYDVIIGKIEKIVDNYYKEFNLEINTQEILKNYGNRGETLSLLHPNCDCSIEIVDEQGNVVYTNANTDKDEQGWGKYLQASIKQLTKYNPAFRNNQGAYTKNDWTSVSNK